MRAAQDGCQLVSSGDDDDAEDQGYEGRLEGMIRDESSQRAEHPGWGKSRNLGSREQEQGGKEWGRESDYCRLIQGGGAIQGQTGSWWKCTN